MDVQLIIAAPGGSKAYIPAVESGIQWSTERRGSPGKLTFSVLGDDSLQMSEGNGVKLTVDGKGVFYGFIFSQKRDKSGKISVTCYDQIRYLKNKDTYIYEGKTAGLLVKMLISDFGLNAGVIEDTGYVIPSRVEENAALLDMIENALDLTLQNNKEMFVLYDDCGKLCLKNISSMYVKENGQYLLIDEESGENFDYSSSIDSDTYNKIKLTFDNEDSGKRDVYIAKDSGNINSWGILQYFDTLKEGENGQAKADALLKLYNKKTRSLKITKAFGDIRVRAGSMIAVALDLGDVKINNFMLVEKVTHKFGLDEHFMDLTLRGGEFTG